FRRIHFHCFVQRLQTCWKPCTKPEQCSQSLPEIRPEPTWKRPREYWLDDRRSLHPVISPWGSAWECFFGRRQRLMRWVALEGIVRVWAHAGSPRSYASAIREPKKKQRLTTRHSAHSRSIGRDIMRKDELLNSFDRWEIRQLGKVLLRSINASKD